MVSHVEKSLSAWREKRKQRERMALLRLIVIFIFFAVIPLVVFVTLYLMSPPVSYESYHGDRPAIEKGE